MDFSCFSLLPHQPLPANDDGDPRSMCRLESGEDVRAADQDYAEGPCALLSQGSISSPESYITIGLPATVTNACPNTVNIIVIVIARCVSLRSSFLSGTSRAGTESR
ncbi:hypothetical protein Rcas_0915 [Roseiflexus castenholzii DSM 13941]|uniref:Uncharacterized protein n=1 Tax=Roseiflexus castenholzii (strain DSM 13941 / HLO8) TaxID=383372 RepID=A7NHT3_ROSCS|nr:hypothetical protein Rcas_0915 [Roseiflexus castenholzii DSM 13941]